VVLFELFVELHVPHGYGCTTYCALCTFVGTMYQLRTGTHVLQGMKLHFILLRGVLRVTVCTVPRTTHIL
jgi:hypothetical protein